MKQLNKTLQSPTLCRFGSKSSLLSGLLIFLAGCCVLIHKGFDLMSR